MDGLDTDGSILVTDVARGRREVTEFMHNCSSVPGTARDVWFMSVESTFSLSSLIMMIQRRGCL